MYDWVTLPYSRKWHNIVNQQYFNKKKLKKKQSQDLGEGNRDILRIVLQAFIETKLDALSKITAIVL